MHDVTVYPTHLSHDKPSMIFRGHEGDSDLPTSDQMDHVDIAPAVIDGIEYPVSLNPLLEGHIKSFSILIPTKDLRSIFTRTGGWKTYHDIYLGEAFIMAGDTVHGVEPGDLLIRPCNR